MPRSACCRPWSTWSWCGACSEAQTQRGRGAAHVPHAPPGLSGGRAALAVVACAQPPVETSIVRFIVEGVTAAHLPRAPPPVVQLQLRALLEVRRARSMYRAAAAAARKATGTCAPSSTCACPITRRSFLCSERAQQRQQQQQRPHLAPCWPAWLGLRAPSSLNHEFAFLRCAAEDVRQRRVAHRRVARRGRAAQRQAGAPVQGG